MPSCANSYMWALTYEKFYAEHSFLMTSFIPELILSKYGWSRNVNLPFHNNNPNLNLCIPDSRTISLMPGMDLTFSLWLGPWLTWAWPRWPLTQRSCLSASSDFSGNLILRMDRISDPVSSKIQPFSSYPVSGWIPDIKELDIQFPNIQPDIWQTGY